jgi:hypothetical protein
MLAGYWVTFALTTGFFVADMAVFQPRYLEMSRQLLHPHLPYGNRRNAEKRYSHAPALRPVLGLELSYNRSKTSARKIKNMSKIG